METEPAGKDDPGPVPFPIDFYSYLSTREFYLHGRIKSQTNNGNVTFVKACLPNDFILHLNI